MASYSENSVETTEDNIQPTINESLVSPEIIEQWDNEQFFLKQKLILEDYETWEFNLNRDQKIIQISELSNKADEDEFYKTHLRYIGGMDLSYIKGCADLACAGLIIFDAADNLKVIYEDINMVNIKQPYVAGYLAFREVPFLVEKLNKVKLNRPEIYPQCVFIDGNGLLHPKRFGLACHLGVLTDTPTIGIAKQLFQVDGLEKNEQFKNDIKEKLKKKGDFIELRSNNENKELMGLCYRTCADNPIYVSIGHKINWKTCLLLINLITTKYRIPEPTRIADIRTREYIRIHHENQGPKKSSKQNSKKSQVNEESDDES